MKVKYFCPFCKAALNVKGNVVLVARKRTDLDNKGVVLLHEEIGNYSSEVSESLKVKPGDVVDFFCPVCLENLQIEKGEGLAGIKHIDEDGKESMMILSRVYGEKSSFQVDADNKIKSYGERISKYIDPEWFIMNR